MTSLHRAFPKREGGRNPSTGTLLGQRTVSNQIKKLNVQNTIKLRAKILSILKDGA